MAMGSILNTIFPGVPLSVALSHCVGAGMQGGIAIGVIGFLVTSIVVGVFAWRRLPEYWGLRRTLVTSLLAGSGGVIVGLIGLSITMVVAFSQC